MLLLFQPPEGNVVIGPALVFSPEALMMLQAYIAAAPTGQEINGFGLVAQENGVFVVREPHDIFITEQTVTAGSADVTAVNVAKAFYHAGDRAPQLRLQWHTHPRGVLHHSSTDLATIRNYGQRGATWTISLVIPKDGPFCARLDAFKPVHLGAEIPVYLSLPASPNFTTYATAQVEELVTVAPLRSKPRRTRR